MTDNLIKSIGSTRKPEEQEDLVDLFYMLANKLLLEQGYLSTFNEIAQQLLKHLDSQELVKINDFFNQELKAYLLLNYANNMVILKKLATANKLSNEATAVVKHAKMRMDGAYLLIATISRQLKNTKQAEATMQKAGDLSYEGDFLSALV